MFQKYSTFKRLSAQIANSHGIVSRICQNRRYSCGARNNSNISKCLWTQSMMRTPVLMDSLRRSVKSVVVNGPPRNILLIHSSVTNFDQSQNGCNSRSQKNDACKPQPDQCQQEVEECTITPCCRPFRLQKEHPMKDSCKKDKNKNKKCNK